VPLTSLLFAACLLQAGVPLPVVVYSDTGERRVGLPVVVPHPVPTPYLRVLTRGYAARLLRLYQLEQRLVRPGRAPQPGVLVLSDNQGGFPRFGLYRDSAQPATAYVDLHRRSAPAGRPGAIDQIFPHELLHVIVHDLAGPPPAGPASQVHAIGVATDRITAFNEGFAEHGQVMSIDDPDAVPETRSLGSDASMRALAFQRFEEYRRALGARMRVAPKAQMTFPLWFSRAEQVLRYHAVRENLFAREPPVPRRLYTTARAYDAYLLDNMLPGRADGPPRSVARLLATEGVISAWFYRFVTDRGIQEVYREEPFYQQFGITREAVDPLDNAYLKLFAAIRAGGHDAAAVASAYVRLFPDEEAALHAIARSVLVDRPLQAPPQLWVLNDAFKTGTSLFDQFRGAPRSHTFDLNASSVADLVAVPGVDVTLAEAIIRAAPFESIDDLGRVNGMAPDVVESLQQMRNALLQPPSSGPAPEARLSLTAVLMPYVWRAVTVWALSAIAGAALYRVVRRVSWWRLLLNGLAAGFVALGVGWTIDPGTGLLALAAPVALFGLPGAAIRAVRSREPREAFTVVLAWALAGGPAAAALTPLG
jgi:DNA uptake protein ComE-like DNA-binding protein